MKILEAGSSVHKVQVYDGTIYVTENNLTWQGEFDCPFCPGEGIDSIVCGEEGIWINFRDDYVAEHKLTYKSKLVRSAPGFDEITSKYFISAYCPRLGNIGLSWLSGNKEGIALYNRVTGEEVIREGKFDLESVLTDKAVIVREMKEGLICFDYQLQPLWQIPFAKTNFSGYIASGPQRFGDLVIVNVGENDTPQRGEFELNAYRIADGALVWQQILEESPSTANLIGDKVYVFVARRFLVIDAATGAIEVDRPHGLSPLSANCYGHGAVVPVADKLLVLGQQDCVIDVYSRDGSQKLQRLSFPEPYAPDIRTQPTEFDGKLYFPLSMCSMFYNPVGGGLLVLPLDELGGEDGVIPVAPRPAFVKENLPDGKQHGYRLSVSHDNLSDIIRLGTRTLKETCLLSGSFVSKRARDKAHNGQVELVVDKAPLAHLQLSDAELLEQLLPIKQRTERSLYIHGDRAGNGKSKFDLKISLA